MIGKLVQLLIFGLAPMFFASLAGSAGALAEERTLTGEVLYRERIALPPNATVRVELADVSLADAPAAIVAEQEVTNAGQVPVKFELRFDSAAIQPGHTFALQARITVDNQLWFLNDERHQVDPLTAGPQTILVKMIRQSDTTAQPSLSGTAWRLEAIEAMKIDAPADLAFESDGKISGLGGCNRFAGQAKIDGDKIGIGDVAATMMACPQPLMDVEGRYFEAFRKVAAFRIENGQLIMSDSAGKELLRFSAGA